MDLIGENIFSFDIVVTVCVFLSFIFFNALSIIFELIQIELHSKITTFFILILFCLTFLTLYEIASDKSALSLASFFFGLDKISQPFFC